MLTDYQFAAISTMLDEAQAELGDVQSPKAAQNFTELRTEILLAEYEHSLQLLKRLLKCPETFRQEFQELCSERAYDALEQWLNYSYLPNGAANKLFYKIALCLFTEGASAIIMPNVTRLISIELEEKLPSLLSFAQTKNLVRNPELKLRVSAFQLAHFEDMSYFAFAEGKAFDLRSLQGLPLRMLRKVFALLEHHSPELLQKIQTHNFSLSSLTADIDLLNNKGQTPKDALQHLAQGLILGGEQVTRQAHATAPAYIACAQFDTYFNQLPVKIQNELVALNGKGVTLAKVLHDLADNQCVETASNNLKLILNENTHHDVLHRCYLMSRDEIHRLERAYRNDTQFNCIKEPSLELPAHHLKKQIALINITELDEWIGFLLNVTPSFYTQFFAHMTTSTFKKVVMFIIKAIQLDFFNLMQLDALTQVFKARMNQWGGSRAAMHLFMQVDSEVVIRGLLQGQEFSEREGRSLLVKALNYPNSLKALLSSYPQDFRWSILLMEVHAVKAMNHKPHVFKVIVSLVSDEDKIKAVQLQNSTKCTVFFNAYEDWHFLQQVLGFYSPEDRFALLKKEYQHTRQDGSLLHRAARYPESLKILLALFPMDELVIELQQLIGFTVYYPDSLRVVLDFCPVELRMKLIQQEGYFTSSAQINRFCWAADSLALLFRSIPQKNHMELLTCVDTNNESLISLMSRYAESFSLLWSIVANEEERFALIRGPGHSNQTLYKNVVDSIGEPWSVLDFVPQNDMVFVYCTALKQLAQMTRKSVLQCLGCFSASPDMRDAERWQSKLHGCDTIQQVKEVLWACFAEPSAVSCRILDALVSDSEVLIYPQKVVVMKRLLHDEASYTNSQSLGTTP